ncbi:dihydropteroate synthase [Ovoidimarina sediminis]|uniref:dihydropteroate synthase n=1 Tax=Ovoidimarina sediminis TaxID=3079856 RepID=UPI002912348B|nr:dihydropteroate synthase [Rhodophyticola sp. MJ-SS7]MDU8943859.1 dihydropteroate synthase [Rhodophyticola sp. MJ-SS7]
MSARIEPLARSGRRSLNALPLAGSAHVWFDTVRPWSGDAVRAVARGPESDRLSALRAPVAGLALDRPRIMGILNVTPDSFSDGGDLPSVEAAVTRAREMAYAADILDIGGESTRPGADPVPETEEIARTVPVIAAIREAGLATPISIDTRKAAVAAAALDAGADIVNDVSAMSYDTAMAGLLAERDVPVCLMHAQGDPKTMQANPTYDDVVAEVADYLETRIEAALAAGIGRDRIILDPGIGFGKTLQHNVSLLRHLAVYHDLGCPILLGASRKRFIGTLGGAEAAKDRMPGSLAVALHAAAQGVQIIRVHDVAQTRQAMNLHLALNGAPNGTEHEAD